MGTRLRALGRGNRARGSSSRMAAKLFGKCSLLGAFMPLASRMQVTVRYLAASPVHLLKRPTFEGPQLPKRPP